MQGWRSWLLAATLGFGVALACGGRTNLDGSSEGDAGGGPIDGWGASGGSGGAGTGGRAEVGGTGAGGGRTGGSGGVGGGWGGGPPGGSGGVIWDGGPPPGATGGMPPWDASIWPGGTGGLIIPDGGSIFDVLPIPDSGPIATCADCMSTHCGPDVNACFANPMCLEGVVCSALSCALDDLGCMLGCFGDPSTMMLGATAMICVMDNCGPDCIDTLLGGFPL